MLNVMFRGNRLSLFGYIEKTKPKCQKMVS